MTQGPIDLPTPDDEELAQAPGVGENLCPECSGSGRRDGNPCPTCGGTGKVIEEVGGA
jgi:hypothetical protein